MLHPVKAFLHRDSLIFENLPLSLKLDIIYGRPPTTMKAEGALEILLHGIYTVNGTAT